VLVVDLLKHIEVVTGVDDLIEQIRMVVAKLHAPLARHIDRLSLAQLTGLYEQADALEFSEVLVDLLPRHVPTLSLFSSMPELRLTTCKQAASCLEVEHQQPYGR
jgi:hypothetical protein